MSTFQMPFYFIKTVSQAEKDAWEFKALRDSISPYYKGNQISASFEPIKGWRPFEKYGATPIEIIHNCLKNRDKTMNKILFRKDWFTIKNACWTISGYNFYHKYYHNPQNILVIPKNMVTGWEGCYNIEINPVNYPESMLSDSCDAFYKRFPSEDKQYILNMKLPYKDCNSHTRSMEAHVFPPAAYELYLMDPSGHIRWVDKGFEKLSVFTSPIDMDPLTFWTRDSSMGGGMTALVAHITSLGEGTFIPERISETKPLLPCFCIG